MTHPTPSSRPSRRAAPIRQRVPFTVLILGLLAGGLCALLALNTATAASEVRQRKIDAANASLSDREQQLSRDLSGLQAPDELARRAAALGLVPADSPAVIRIGQDGKVVVLGSAAPATTQPPPGRPPPHDRCAYDGCSDNGTQDSVAHQAANRRHDHRGQAHAEAETDQDPDPDRDAARRPAMNPVSGRVPPARRASSGRRRSSARLGNTRVRISIGFGAVCVLLLVVTGRLVQLQGVGDHDYAAAAAAERLTTVSLHAARGSITDRNNVVLAYTADAKDIVADPTQVNAAVPAGASCKTTTKLDYAMRLAALSGTSVNDLLAAFARPGQYAMLAKAIPPGEASRIDALNLCGIYVEPTTQRLYPGGTTGANAVGFVDSAGVGSAGIELSYDDLLKGTDGTYTYERTANGSINPAGVSRRVAAVNGGSVQLTISQDLQFWTQTKLVEAVKQSGAKSGQVVVLDARTGQVLALASSSTFNSQDPNTAEHVLSYNAPIMTYFEPGSVNKVVTFSAALQNKLITPLTVSDVPDFIDMGGVTVHDAWWHPVQKFTATGILAESSNVGTLQIAQKVGPDAFMQYARAYGLGTRTGIELPGEITGSLPAQSSWSDSTFANLPIGQGVAMTALQMTSMYQAIANDGVRIAPRIVAKVTNPDGTVVTTPQPAGVQVTSVETARTLRTMLEAVMLKGGTGTRGAIAGYRIAGKTGTAQQPDPARGGAYSDSIYWDTYAGMVPADNPRFVVGIMIDNPAHGLHGGDVAAPLFREIAAYQLQHDAILPSGTLSTPVPLTIP